MSYEDLSDEDKVLTSIGFVASGTPLPAALRDFLKKEELYEAIVAPGGEAYEHSEREHCRRKTGLLRSYEEDLPSSTCAV